MRPRLAPTAWVAVLALLWPLGVRGMSGVDTSLTAPEAVALLSKLDQGEAVGGVALRIRQLALLLKPDAQGQWVPEAPDEFAASVAALRRLKARGHRLIGLVDLDHCPWTTTRRPGSRGSLPRDLREVHALARALRAHLDGLVDVWEVGNEPEIFLADNAEDYVAALKAFYLGYTAETGTPRRSTVMMAALAEPPGPYLRAVVANDLLRFTEAYNFHLYGFAEDIGPFYDQQLRAVRELANSVAPGRRRWGRTDLPVFLTEVGYGGVIAEEMTSAEARRRQARWFAIVKQELQQRRPEAVLAFVLKPYVSPLGREMGLVVPDGQGGYAATPALTAWLEPARHRRPSEPLRLPRWVKAAGLVIDFLPDEKLERLSDQTGYWVRAAEGSGTVLLYNFSGSRIAGTIEWPRGMQPRDPGGRSVQLEPGECKAIPVTVHAPAQSASATVQVMTGPGAAGLAVWSVVLRPSWGVPAVVEAEPFRFHAEANRREQARLATPPRVVEEPGRQPSGRWLVTEGVEVRETDDAWTITIHRMPPEARWRRAVAELPLPQPCVVQAREQVAFTVTTAGQAEAEVTVQWRTAEGALFVSRSFIADGQFRLFSRPMIDFTQSFFSRAAREWRVERQRFVSFGLAFRPLTPLPVTVIVGKAAFWRY